MGVADETGLWDSVVLPPAPGFHVPKPTTTSLLALERPNVPSQELLPCFVGVEFNVPFSIDGVHGTSVRVRARALLACECQVR